VPAVAVKQKAQINKKTTLSTINPKSVKYTTIDPHILKSNKQ